MPAPCISSAGAGKRIPLPSAPAPCAWSCRPLLVSLRAYIRSAAAAETPAAAAPAAELLLPAAVLEHKLAALAAALVRRRSREAFPLLAELESLPLPPQMRPLLASLGKLLKTSSFSRRR